MKSGSKFFQRIKNLVLKKGAGEPALSDKYKDIENEGVVLTPVKEKEEKERIFILFSKYGGLS